MRLNDIRQSGFLLPAAIFLLVTLAGLGAYAVNIYSVQQHTGTQDIKSARVYHRARGIVEYGIYLITAANTANNFADCPTMSGSVNNTDSLSTSTITLTCQASYHTEQGGDSLVKVYSLQSKVSTGTVNTADFAERQIDVTISHTMQSTTPPTAAVQCATENNTCTIPAGETAVVWYGENTSWYIQIGQTNSFTCNNSKFGDPLYGAGKRCLYLLNN